MSYIKNYKMFLEEFVMSSPRPGTIETPVETPVTPALPIPTEIPDEQDNPLAKAEDVINRLSNLYSKEDRKGKSEIDSYFEEK